MRRIQAFTTTTLFLNLRLQLNQRAIRDGVWLSSSLNKETLIIATHISQFKTTLVGINVENVYILIAV